MSNRLNSFKIDIKKAVNAYALKKGGIDKLKDDRKTPCVTINTYLDTTTDEWKNVKFNVQKEVQKLIKGWLGRSQLRDMINVVFNDPHYSNDKFYKDEIRELRHINKKVLKKNTELTKENKVLSEENAKIPVGRIMTMTRSRLGTLKNKIKNLETEVNALTDKKKDLEETIAELKKSADLGSSSSRDSSAEFLESYSSLLDAVSNRNSFDSDISLRSINLNNTPPQGQTLLTLTPTLFQASSKKIPVRAELIEIEEDNADSDFLNTATL